MSRAARPRARTRGRATSCTRRRRALPRVARGGGGSARSGSLGCSMSCAARMEHGGPLLHVSNNRSQLASKAMRDYFANSLRVASTSFEVTLFLALGATLSLKSSDCIAPRAQHSVGESIPHSFVRRLATGPEGFSSCYERLVAPSGRLAAAVAVSRLPWWFPGAAPFYLLLFPLQASLFSPFTLWIAVGCAVLASR